MTSCEDLAAQLRAWAASGVPLLDLREAEAFAARRLKGPVANISWRRLHDEAFLLPPRDVPFALLIPCSEDCAGRNVLDRDTVRFSDFTAGRGCCWDVKASFDTSPRSPWMLRQILVDLPQLWDFAAADDLIEKSEVACSMRLWVPTPLLEETVERIEAVLEAQGPPGPRSCMDLGCGSGRDVGFLALRGWDVVAVDNMQKALQRVEQLARSSGVLERVRLARVDVKRSPEELRQLAGEGLDLLLISRFFHRPLLPLLPELVRPGGLVLISHFRDGVQHHEIGHPTSPDDFLLCGELRAAFADWNALVDDEETCLPDGRPMATLLAQRPVS